MPTPQEPRESEKCCKECKNTNQSKEAQIYCPCGRPTCSCHVYPPLESKEEKCEHPNIKRRGEKQWECEVCEEIICSDNCPCRTTPVDSIWKEEAVNKLKKYFGGLIHYQYDINNEYPQAQEIMEVQRTDLNNDFIEFISKIEAQAEERGRKEYIESYDSIFYDKYLEKYGLTEYRQGLLSSHPEQSVIDAWSRHLAKWKEDVLEQGRQEAIKIVEELNFRPRSPCEDPRDFQNKMKGYLYAKEDLLSKLQP